MGFLKLSGGMIVGGLVTLAVLVGGISWWRADPATHQQVLAVSGHGLVWLAVVLALPWASFFVVGRVARLDSNAAGAVLVGAYTVLEVAWLAWLFSFKFSGATALTALAAAGLFAAGYNIFTCDWIAEKI